MRYLLKYVRAALVAIGLLKPRQNVETPRPRRQRYVRGNSGSSSEATLKALEAILRELEAIRDALESK